MNKCVIAALSFWMFLMNANAEALEAYEIPNTQVIPVKDSQSDKEYELYVKLPDGYDDSESTRYPVIYITDAVWHIEILSAATAFLLEDVILVGISWQKDLADDLLQEYGESASRFTDYSFWTKANPNHPKLRFGGAKAHLSFIQKDVIPYVETKYRTQPNQRTLFGYSLSGLFGAYTLMIQPNLFQNYIIGSPNVRLLMEGESKVPFPDTLPSANVFIAHGDLETDRTVGVATFADMLRDKSTNDQSIEYAIIEGDHQTAFPGTGLSSIKWLAKLLSEEAK